MQCFHCNSRSLLVDEDDPGTVVCMTCSRVQPGIVYDITNKVFVHIANAPVLPKVATKASAHAIWQAAHSEQVKAWHKLSYQRRKEKNEATKQCGSSS